MEDFNGSAAEAKGLVNEHQVPDYHGLRSRSLLPSRDLDINRYFLIQDGLKTSTD